MIIELKYGDYRFSEFAENVRNSAPTSMYSEQWMNKMLEIATKSVSLNVDEMITFSDKRLIMIAYKSMLKVSLRKVGLMEWAIVRSYFDFYSNEDKKVKSDFKEFVNLYIANTFSLAELTDKQVERMNELKEILSTYNVEIPDFFSKAISKEVSIDKTESILKQWRELKEFCEIALMDSKLNKADKNKYQKLLISCALFV
jgi:hypothetical protein